MGRILAIDYGTKRTGLAASDPTQTIAGMAETISTAALTDYLTKYIPENSVNIIVLGKPMRLDGSASDTLPAIEKLADNLRKRFPGAKVDFYDERFTSVLAHRAMIDGGVKKMDRRDKGLADRISAAIILQDYLDNVVNKNKL